MGTKVNTIRSPLWCPQLQMQPAKKRPMPPGQLEDLTFSINSSQIFSSKKGILQSTTIWSQKYTKWQWVLRMDKSCTWPETGLNDPCRSLLTQLILWNSIQRKAMFPLSLSPEETQEVYGLTHPKTHYLVILKTFAVMCYFFSLHVYYFPISIKSSWYRQNLCNCTTIKPVGLDQPFKYYHNSEY